MHMITDGGGDGGHKNVESSISTHTGYNGNSDVVVSLGKR